MRAAARFGESQPRTPVLGGHAGVEERVALVVRVLLGGRDARVSEEHGVENTGPTGILVVDSRREFSTPLGIECGLAGRASTNDRFSSTPHGRPSSSTGRRPRLGRILCSHARRLLQRTHSLKEARPGISDRPKLPGHQRRSLLATTRDVRLHDLKRTLEVK
jgi:hypothetical protein